MAALRVAVRLSATTDLWREHLFLRFVESPLPRGRSPTGRVRVKALGHRAAARGLPPHRPNRRGASVRGAVLLHPRRSDGCAPVGCRHRGPPRREAALVRRLLGYRILPPTPDSLPQSQGGIHRPRARTLLDRRRWSALGDIGFLRFLERRPRLARAGGRRP